MQGDAGDDRRASVSTLGPENDSAENRVSARMSSLTSFWHLTNQSVTSNIDYVATSGICQGVGKCVGSRI